MVGMKHRSRYGRKDAHEAHGRNEAQDQVWWA
jgi:hypothetical protein